MSKKKEEVQVNLGLKKILVKEYSIKFVDRIFEPNHRFDFNFLFNAGLSKESNALVSTASVSVVEEAGSDNVLCSLVVDFVFQVENLSAFINEDNKINELLIFHTNSICLSSLRGILFEKNSDTYLRDLIMPLVDSRLLFPKEIPSDKDK